MDLKEVQTLKSVLVEALKAVDCATEVGAVVTAMRRHPVSGDLQGRACNRLSRLIENNAATMSLARDAGAIEAVIAAMRTYAADSVLQGKACHTLSNFNTGVDVKTAVRAKSAGAIEAVVAAMRTHAGDHEVLCQGCQALSNFNTGNDRETRARAGSAGAIEALVATLRRDVCVMVLVQASTALHNITCDCAANTTRARDAGAVEAVVAAMRKHARIENMQIRSCIILFALTNGSVELTNGSVEHTTRAVNAGAVEAVVMAMRLHPHSALLNDKACRQLYIFMRDNGESAARAGKVGAVEDVVAAMLRHADCTSTMVQTHACFALDHLVKGNAQNTIRAGLAGAIEAVKTTIHRHASNEQVQQKARETLFALGKIYLKGFEADVPVGASEKDVALGVKALRAVVEPTAAERAVWASGGQKSVSYTQFQAMGILRTFDEEKSCMGCGSAKARQKCTRCWGADRTEIRYCSRVCQLSHWNHQAGASHKTECRSRAAASSTHG